MKSRLLLICTIVVFFTASSYAQFHAVSVLSKSEIKQYVERGSYNVAKRLANKIENGSFSYQLLGVGQPLEGKDWIFAVVKIQWKDGTLFTTRSVKGLFAFDSYASAPLFMLCASADNNTGNLAHKIISPYTSFKEATFVKMKEKAEGMFNIKLKNKWFDIKM